MYVLEPFRKKGFFIWAFIVILLVQITNAYAADTFLDWNDSADNGTNWSGWQYCDGSVESCIGYGLTGWKRNDYALYSNTPLPRSFPKTDYGNDSLASIDTTFLPPSNSDGASLKVYDAGTGTRYQPAWWLWEGPEGMQGMGITTADTDRLSTYIYLDGPPDITDPDTNGYTFGLGTYTCWEGGAFNGDSCPTESDNGHFYHSATVAPNMWVHILYDEHPYHQRGISDFPPNNPTLVSDGKDYFAHLYNTYFQLSQPVDTPSTSQFWIDELKFTSAEEMGEPSQNDESITNIWIGYQPQDDHWEIGWNDVSVDGSVGKEYEIRWSTSPITNANFSSTAVVQPMDFNNGTLLRKSNTWKMQLWTRFDLPAGAESNSKLYFAVKDVTVGGVPAAHYVAAPTPDIHTIDYALPSLISSPQRLKIIE